MAIEIITTNSAPKWVTFLEKPVTKCSLFVIAFFLAGGAAYCHYLKLRIPLIGFGAASFVTAAFATINCVKSRDEAPTQKKTHSDDKVKTKIIDLNPEVNKQKKSKKIIPLTHQTQEGKVAQEIHSKVERAFADHASQGSEAVAKALQPIFHQLEPSSTFVGLPYISPLNQYSLLFRAQVLEHLKWPDESLKFKLSNAFVHDIHSALILDTDAHLVRYPSGEADSYDYDDKQDAQVLEMRIHSQEIFGDHDFTLRPAFIPPFFAKAIADAIRQFCTEKVKEFRDPKHSKRWVLDSGLHVITYPLGIRLMIGSPKLTESMIAPILTYMDNIPGLVDIRLLHKRGDDDDGFKTQIGQGFRDQDVDLLLNFFRNNPLLAFAKIRIGNMSPDNQQKLQTDWEAIRARRKQNHPTEAQIYATLPRI